MNATKLPRLTKHHVLAAARKRWPKCQIIENKNAATVEEKTALRVEYQARLARKDQLKEERETLGNVAKRLRDAARFAIDVNGDEPSWSQLEAATVAAERMQAITEEEAEIRESNSKVSSRLLRERWEICEDDYKGPIPLRFQHARADTLEDLYAKIGGRTP